MKHFTKIVLVIWLLLATVAWSRAASTISANFNGTPIPAGSKIWFSSILKITGTATYPLTIYFTNQTISSPSFTLSVPDAVLILDPSVTTATTVFNGTAWVTTAAPDEPSFFFLSGYSDSLTADLPGSLDPVTWTGTFTASRPDVSINWHMAAAVYTSFNANLNALGVKPSHCTTCSVYLNSDNSGTPENYLAFVTGGARGGGGGNYTGGYSEVGVVTPDMATNDLTLCVGGTSVVTPIGGGGSWSSSNTAIATVNSSGTVTGVFPGTASISYTINGCSIPQVSNVSVYTMPAITAAAWPGTLCAGETLHLNAMGATGTDITYSWSGPDGFSATVKDPVRTGITTAMAGTYTVTATNSNGCAMTATATVTVNSTISAGTITGGESVCAGASTSLSASQAGGSWSSGSPGIATVNAAGVVTGITGGIATIFYTVSGGCGSAGATKTITVNAAPNAGSISGNASVCVGAPTTLTNCTSGGVWSSGAPGIASVTTSGVVSAISSGTAAISYNITTSCGSATATKIVTVNVSSGGLTGPSAVTAGSNILLTVSGGSWSSSNTAIATVDGGGNVTGISGGTAMISYTVSNGCYSLMTTKIVTVNNIAIAPVTGTLAVCSGASATLSDATPGGSWSSNNTAVATVTGAGIISGISAGTAIISYSLYSSVATVVVTVNQSPASITGSGTICVGLTTAFSNTVTGGTWSSSNPSVASIGATSGIATGIASGSAVIMYNMPGACSAATTVNVTSVAAITGTPAVCVGAATSLADATTGGAWSSSATDIATVTSAGIVNGISAGISNVTYTAASGCYAVQPITVNAMPSAISGPAAMCAGTTAIYTVASTGGTWSTAGSNISLNASGNVSALTAGGATITYTMPGGCFTAKSLTVNAAPAAISGLSTLCIGGTITLADSTGGGAWGSGDVSVATVSGTGIVTGITAGTAVVTYTVSSGCMSQTTVTVLSGLPAISGNAPVCAGSTLTLADAISGGTWSSSAPAIASVDAGTGVVTGVFGGTARITYATTGGCSTNIVVTVNQLLAINGNTATCVGNNTTLTDATTGGTWISGNTSVAAIGLTSGIVTGISNGTSVITYTVSNGCSRMATVNITTLSSITGTQQVCVGLTTTLSNAIAGGTWSSGTTAVATINSTTGIATGVASGTSVITYTSGTCKATSVLTVNASPAVISGPTSVCIGSSVILTDATTGGSWSSTSSGIGMSGVTSNSVTVTGVSAGMATVSYTAGSQSCYRTFNVSVNPLPAAIAGTFTVCPGGTTTLTDATPGGTWSSSNTAQATILSTGLMTGVATGTATITYRASTSCIATVVATVIAGPAPITGPSEVCTSSSITLSDASGGGTWNSNNSSMASVGSTTGVVTGVTAGFVNITFTLGATGCKTKTAITVISIPNAGTLSGPSSVAVGSSITLTSSGTAGGSWSSSDSSASVNASGVVTGISAGSATITYAVTNSCGYSGAYKPVSVAAGRAAQPANTPFGSGRNGVGNTAVGTTAGSGTPQTPVAKEAVAATTVLNNISAPDVRIIPNPTKGSFTIKGNFDVANDEILNMEIVNVLGQSVYRSRIIAQKGLINESVQLSNVANGTYLLNITGHNISKTLHFTVRQ